jgi:hypothetical protein
VASSKNDKLIKLSGSPFSNVTKWVYEKRKQITPNPLKPTEKKTTTEKKIHVKSLQESLSWLILSLNPIRDSCKDLT